MRYGRDNGILKSESGLTIGINLGADYVSEHEWGIDKIKEMFGIPKKGYGLERRTITKIPNEVKFTDTKKHTMLVTSRYVHEEWFNNPVDRHKSSGDQLITAWDGDSFGVSAVKEEDREAIRTLYEAMQKNDLAIWLGGGGVFQNAGLVLAIASLVPADKAQVLYDADMDREKLEKAAEKTGIATKLAKAELRYFALSPKWASTLTSTKNGEIETKHPVVFWLNPMEQNYNNYGWFTVEQLEQWIKGEGPIPKKRG